MGETWKYPEYGERPGQQNILHNSTFSSFNFFTGLGFCFVALFWGAGRYEFSFLGIEEAKKYLYSKNPMCYSSEAVIVKVMLSF